MGTKESDSQHTRSLTIICPNNDKIIIAQAPNQQSITITLDSTMYLEITLTITKFITLMVGLIKGLLSDIERDS